MSDEPNHDSQTIEATLVALGDLRAQVTELTALNHRSIAERQAINTRMTAIEQTLGRNTDMTSELLDVISAVRGGFKVLGWLGTGAKWIGGIAAAATAIWVLIYMITHGGSKP